MQASSRISIAPFACIMGATMLLLLPLQWILAAGIAAAFHEALHIAAVYFTTGYIRRFRIDSDGAVLEAAPMSPAAELLCTLAGPAAGFLLLPFLHRIPRIAFCGLIQSLFNLLPLQTLDGGRALRCLLGQLLPRSAAERVCHVLEILCLSGLTLIAFYLWLWLDLGLTPVLVSAALWIRSRGRKPLQTVSETGTIVLPYSKR